MRRVLLGGGGHAQLEVLRRLAEAPRRDVELILVSPVPAAAYSGMLPGVIAGHYPAEAMTVPLGPLVRAAGGRLVIDRIGGIDPEGRRVWLEGQGWVTADLVSLDTGAAPAPGGPPAIPVKPVESFLDAWHRALTGLRPDTRIAVQGAGSGGIEIAFAIARLLAIRALPAQVILVERGPRIAPALPPRAARVVLRWLKRRGIAVETGRETLPPVDLVIRATGVVAPAWLQGSGLPRDSRGFLTITETLQVPGHPWLLAAGDVASLQGHDLAKAGVHAVRQGPVLARNLIAQLEGRPPGRFRPQARFLNLIMTGPRHAIAHRNGITLSGGWVWAWKDRIDRRFIARYRLEGV